MTREQWTSFYKDCVDTDKYSPAEKEHIGTIVGVVLAKMNNNNLAYNKLSLKNEMGTLKKLINSTNMEISHELKELEKALRY